MTRITDYKVKRMKNFAPDVELELTLEDGTTLELTVSVELGYNLGSKLRKRIEVANMADPGSNGGKYSEFYGMGF